MPTAFWASAASAPMIRGNIAPTAASAHNRILIFPFLPWTVEAFCPCSLPPQTIRRVVAGSPASCSLWQRTKDQARTLARPEAEVQHCLIRARANLRDALAGPRRADYHPPRKTASRGHERAKSDGRNCARGARLRGEDDCGRAGAGGAPDDPLRRRRDGVARLGQRAASGAVARRVRLVDSLDQERSAAEPPLHRDGCRPPRARRFRHAEGAA